MDEQHTLGIGSRLRHPEFGSGVIIQVKHDAYLITFIDSGLKEIAKSFPSFEIIEANEPSTDLVSFEDMERSLIKILRQFADIQETVPIADKWRGGRMAMYPGNTDLKPYEMPIGNFYHKIVMVRDRLRVMEQKINASKLEEDEKIELQQYITRIYGSLTSFNILFKYKEDNFIGAAKD